MDSRLGWAALAVIVVTIAWFAPVMIALTERRGEGLTDDVIVRKARTGTRLQDVRLAAVVAAWVTAICALRSS